MRDCQPTPRGDGHRPWKLWLERHSKDTEGCPLDFDRQRWPLVAAGKSVCLLAEAIAKSANLFNQGGRL